MKPSIKSNLRILEMKRLRKLLWNKFAFYWEKLCRTAVRLAIAVAKMRFKGVRGASGLVAGTDVYIG